MNIKSGNSERRAILVSISIDGGDMSINLDDVQHQVASTPSTWIQRQHYTAKNFPTNALDELSFDEKELADFGYAIISRLHAFRMQGEV